MLYRISCPLEFRLLKCGENPIFLALVVSDALLQTLLPFPHPLLSLLIFYGFARIKVQCFFLACTVLALLCSFVLNTKPVWSNNETVLKFKFYVQGNNY